MVHRQAYDGRRVGRWASLSARRNGINGMWEGLASLCRSSLQAYSGMSLNLYQWLMREAIQPFIEKSLNICLPRITNDKSYMREWSVASKQLWKVRITSRGLYLEYLIGSGWNYPSQCCIGHPLCTLYLSRFIIKIVSVVLMQIWNVFSSTQILPELLIRPKSDPQGFLNSIIGAGYPLPFQEMHFNFSPF